MAKEAKITVEGTVSYAEAATTGTGKPLFRFTIANQRSKQVDGKWEKVGEVTWFACTKFDVSSIAGVEKGAVVKVEGTLSEVRAYNSKTGEAKAELKLIAGNVEVVFPAKKGYSQPAAKNVNELFAAVGATPLESAPF